MFQNILHRNSYAYLIIYTTDLIHISHEKIKFYKIKEFLSRKNIPYDFSIKSVIKNLRKQRVKKNLKVKKKPIYLEYLLGFLVDFSCF